MAVGGPRRLVEPRCAVDAVAVGERYGRQVELRSDLDQILGQGSAVQE